MGRVGGLICWENYMPLVRFALFAQGCEIYIAPTWDEGDTWISTMRHIAGEGRCWVLGSGCAMRGKDIPKDFPQRAKLFPDLESWYNPGDSVIVNPRGGIDAVLLVERPGHDAASRVDDHRVARVVPALEVRKQLRPLREVLGNVLAAHRAAAAEHPAPPFGGDVAHRR